MSEQRYSIGKTAEITGLTAHTLRYYDKEGLLPFVERTESGLRSFKEEDLGWLNLIACLKKTGMPIKDIRHYIDLCMLGDSTLGERIEIFKNQKRLVEAQMAELNSFLETLEYKIQYYENMAKAQP